MLGSDEFFAGHGHGTAAGFLQALYTDLLGRTLDQAGWNYWANLVGQGAARSQVAGAILNSTEFLFVD